VKATGLGLAMAYGTVHRHGGQIALEAGPGQGTTVTFWLPAVPTQSEAVAEATDPLSETLGSVLIIDDEAAVRDLVAEALVARGHRIAVAASGREGLARFESEPYDVVLTDLGMPDLNGWEVARAIKGVRGETPVLLITGWADAVDPSTTGLVDGILRKPFDLGDLAAAVTAVLAEKT
jgi:CheY-like chemotaxis protein